MIKNQLKRGIHMKIIPLLILSLAIMGCVPESNHIKRTHVAPHEAPIGYTQVVQHGNRLFLSGVAVAGPDMEQAVSRAYSHIEKILQDHGSDMGHVVKKLLFPTNMAAMKAQTETRKKYNTEGQYPATSWIEVKGLFLPELILEVEVEAVVIEQ